MEFRERLTQLREENDLSKRELAVKLGIPPSTYYDYENGKTQPDLSKIIKIAEFFDVNSDKTPASKLVCKNIWSYTPYASANASVRFTVRIFLR